MAGLSLRVPANCFLNSKSIDRLSNLKLAVFVTTWGKWDFGTLWARTEHRAASLEKAFQFLVKRKVTV